MIARVTEPKRRAPQDPEDRLDDAGRQPAGPDDARRQLAGPDDAGRQLAGPGDSKPEPTAEPVSGATSSGLEVRPVRTGHGRVIAVLVLLVVVLLAFVLARSSLGRWWAGKIADACDGQFSVAIPLGLAIGLACSAITLLALREVFRRARSWTPSFLAAVVALVAISPLVITLLIAVGNSRTAEAASRTLDREAPGFSPSVLVGTLAGTALVSGLWWLLRSRRKLRTQIADLRQRLAALEAAAAATPEATSTSRGRAGAQ